jgi:hypothetical protein
MLFTSFYISPNISFHLKDISKRTITTYTIADESVRVQVVSVDSGSDPVADICEQRNGPSCCRGGWEFLGQMHDYNLLKTREPWS